MQPYPIPAGPISVSEEIKKSRFITLLAPTSGVDAAKAFIQQVRDEHPAARHHCWAFVAGPPTDSQQLGFSDDGEPSGTAGKPILAQLMGSGIGEITAVVVRQRGAAGIKTVGRKLQDPAGRIYFAMRLCSVGAGRESVAANRRADCTGGIWCLRRAASGFTGPRR